MQTALKNIEGLEGKCCWDLGAHFGFYSVAFARLVGKNGVVFSFEPSPRAFEKLNRHKKLNQLSQLKIFNAAVSDSSGTKELLNYGEEYSTTSHFAFSGESTGKVPLKTKVTTHSLDQLVEEGILLLPHIIKLDVEGHGHMVLKGAFRSIKKSRPTIFMGIHCPEEIEAVEKLLENLHYFATSESGVPIRRLPQFGDVVLCPKKIDY